MVVAVGLAGQIAGQVIAVELAVAAGEIGAVDPAIGIVMETGGVEVGVLDAREIAFGVVAIGGAVVGGVLDGGEPVGVVVTVGGDFGVGVGDGAAAASREKAAARVPRSKVTSTTRANFSSTCEGAGRGG